MKKTCILLLLFLLLLPTLFACEQPPVPMSRRKTFSSQEEMIALMKGTWRTEPEKSIGGTTFHYIRIEADGSMTVHYCFEDSTGYEPVDSVYNVSPVFCPEEGLIRDSKGSTVWYAQLEPRVALIQKTGKTVSEYYHIELE